MLPQMVKPRLYLLEQNILVHGALTKYYYIQSKITRCVGHTIAVQSPHVSIRYPVSFILSGCYTSILNGSSHLYVVAVIGFTQTAYTFEEGDGTVEVCAAFLDPTQSAPNVVIELMGSTSPSTYPAYCVNLYSTVVSKKSTHVLTTLRTQPLQLDHGTQSQLHGQSTLPVCYKGRGWHCFKCFRIQP